MAEVKDPVCAMAVDSHKAAGRSVYQGEAYYFCSDNCKQAFDDQPARYVRTGVRSGAAAGLRTNAGAGRKVSI
ncbi:MAG: YHS domain-containing protein [Gemmatimonadetes bacterium]|nr:YHS domain-containing protein [Gemmatimonadota bacterium]